jgi:YD repeat-containing protein
VLAKVSANPIRYEQRLRDGAVEVFAQSDGVITSGRRIYLTDAIDPQGLSIHLTYDSSLRLVAVTDAIGLVTTLSYELASDRGDGFRRRSSDRFLGVQHQSGIAG